MDIAADAWAVSKKEFGEARPAVTSRFILYVRRSSVAEVNFRNLRKEKKVYSSLEMSHIKGEKKNQKYIVLRILEMSQQVSTCCKYMRTSVPSIYFKS